LIADGYDIEPETERYVYGLVGAAAGVTLATTALTFKGMGEGGATLTHSGGAFGLVFGGLTQIMIEGDTDATPTRGMGYGAGAGVLAAGIVATPIQVSSSRVLLMDLGSALGGLGGAAAASPLVFGENETEPKNRLWVGAIAAGAVAGGAITYFVTQSSPESSRREQREFVALPRAGVVAASPSETGEAHPAVGGREI